MEDRERNRRMSEELIRRSDAIKALKDNMVEMGGDDFSEMGVHSDDIDAVINGIPTIEPKRGEWKMEVAETIYGRGYKLTCSECGETVSVTEYALPYEHFCRNCGADMRGKDDE